jgi:hypothetical protein
MSDTFNHYLQAEDQRDDLEAELGEDHSIKCRYCGVDDLHWEEVEQEGKLVWRLFRDDGEMHSCRDLPGLQEAVNKLLPPSARVKVAPSTALSRREARINAQLMAYGCSEEDCLPF